jgi:DNA-binding transcriptional MerR regulator
VAERRSARRVAKSPGAFRTISEVAQELDVPQHVLRFWEGKFSQIRPLKRGGGRRYYRPEDVELLRRIRSLLYGEGYTIKGVQKVLRESGRRGDGTPVAGAPLGPSRRAELEGIVVELRSLQDMLLRRRR